MKKIITTVKTIIDNERYTFTGTLSKCGKILKIKKGMILTVCDNDIVSSEEIEIIKRSPKFAYVPEMYKLLKASKQI